jgi:hypothetical protein
MLKRDEPRISSSDVTKAEGKRNNTTLFTFTVTLSAAYDETVTMSFRTVNGTAKTGDSDYVAKTGTLTFAPGETTKTITIAVKGDSKKEANETFYLDLFGNSSNSLFTKTAASARSSTTIERARTPRPTKDAVSAVGSVRFTCGGDAAGGRGVTGRHRAPCRPSAERRRPGAWLCATTDSADQQQIP